jgi:hypothetical protein
MACAVLTIGHALSEAYRRIYILYSSQGKVFRGRLPSQRRYNLSDAVVLVSRVGSQQFL